MSAHTHDEAGPYEEVCAGCVLETFLAMLRARYPDTAVSQLPSDAALLDEWDRFNQLETS